MMSTGVRCLYPQAPSSILTDATSCKLAFQYSRPRFYLCEVVRSASAVCKSLISSVVKLDQAAVVHLHVSYCFELAGEQWSRSLRHWFKIQQS